MTYKVLALKWRPQKFEEVVGQTHVVRALQNALKHNKLHHAYLFSGTRGVGKTTLARILAKAMNCEQGPTAIPCDKCALCVAVNESKSIDLIEIDAASNTKVEDMRQLLDRAQYAPAIGCYKILLIDEVHMLSNHSFNALLKTLEEPPSHLKFIFATTEPQKIPDTILSRCLHFSLKRVSTIDLMTWLKKILAEEKIPYSEKALYALVEAGEGSVRDTLSLLDQVSNFAGDEDLSEQAVQNCLGFVGPQVVLDLLTCIMQQNRARLFNDLAAMHTWSPDYHQVLKAMLTLLHHITLGQFNSEYNTPKIYTNAQFNELCEKLTPETVQFFIEQCLHGQKSLSLWPNPKDGFEIIIIRLLVFDYGSVVKKINSKKNVVNTNITNTNAANITAVLENKTSDIIVNKFPDASAKNIETKTANYNEKNLTTKSQEKTLSNPKIGTNGLAENSTTQKTRLENLTKQQWLVLVPKLSLQGIANMLLSNSVFVKVQENTIYVTLAQAQKSMLTPKQTTIIQQALSKYFNQNIYIEIQLGEIISDTPSVHNQKQQQAYSKQVYNEISSDPKVEKILQTFNTQIDSIVTVKDHTTSSN